MTNKQIFDAVVDIYTELYQQATLRQDYTLNVSPVVTNQISGFITALYKQYASTDITPEFLIRYFEWQFNRYMGVKTKHGTNSILLHWLIGKKAVKEWNERNVKDNWKIKVNVRKTFRLQLHKAFTKQTTNENSKMVSELLLTTDPTEEATKLKFYGKPELLAWCGTVNTLFTPASDLCLKCTCQEACRKLLKTNYPKTYKIRLAAWRLKVQKLRMK